jgi:hypothetical protein
MATRLKTLQYALAVCMLIAAPASANPVYKESISQSPAKIASAKNEHFVSKPRSIAETIEHLIAAPDWQPGYTMVLTSAVNSMRLTLSMESAVKKISLLDAHSGSVAGEWRIDDTTPPKGINQITDAVLFGMGLKKDQITNKAVQHKNK